MDFTKESIQMGKLGLWNEKNRRNGKGKSIMSALLQRHQGMNCANGLKLCMEIFKHTDETESRKGRKRGVASKSTATTSST